MTDMSLREILALCQKLETAAVEQSSLSLAGDITAAVQIIYKYVKRDYAGVVDSDE